MNTRILPHVCKNCYDLILPPFENLHEYINKNVEVIEVCRKCKHEINKNRYLK